MFLRQIATQATFTPDKMAKHSLAGGASLFAGLNAFEPGQEHAPHTHPGQDKLYLILQGRGIVQVGEASELLSAGDAAFAAAGVVHAIRNPGPERLIVMAVLAPPPK
jgi:quercetin dioxygenase-like cupin family protein